MGFLNDICAVAHESASSSDGKSAIAVGQDPINCNTTTNATAPDGATPIAACNATASVPATASQVPKSGGVSVVSVYTPAVAVIGGVFAFAL